MLPYKPLCPVIALTPLGQGCMSALCYQLDRWEQQSRHGKSSAFRASSGDHGCGPSKAHCICTTAAQPDLCLAMVLRQTRKIIQHKKAHNFVSLDTLCLGWGTKGAQDLRSWGSSSQEPQPAGPRSLLKPQRRCSTAAWQGICSELLSRRLVPVLG